MLSLSECAFNVRNGTLAMRIHCPKQDHSEATWVSVASCRLSLGSKLSGFGCGVLDFYTETLSADLHTS